MAGADIIPFFFRGCQSLKSKISQSGGQKPVPQAQHGSAGAEPTTVCIDTAKWMPHATFAQGHTFWSGGVPCPLGRHRWLVRAVAPVTGEIGGENTGFQEL